MVIGDYFFDEETLRAKERWLLFGLDGSARLVDGRRSIASFELGSPR